MSGGFNINPAAIGAHLRLVTPEPERREPPAPALSTIGLYALAELWHSDPEMALKLAAENAENHWSTR